jgi:hypothetical protein
LLYLNQKNSLKIQKYIDSCLGAKRHIMYDISGLYTQAEIKKMASEQEQRARERATELQ